MLSIKEYESTSRKVNITQKQKKKRILYPFCGKDEPVFGCIWDTHTMLGEARLGNFQYLEINIV